MLSSVKLRSRMNKILILLTLISVGLVNAYPSTNTNKVPTPGFIRNYPSSIGSNYDHNIKVIGGEDAEPGEFPYQATMQVKPIFGERRHHCGGIIINPTHIVTAAHCVEGQILNQVTIIAGAHNQKVDEPSQQIRNVKRLIWHDDFHDELLTNDCAVITLTSPLTFTEWVQPLSLAKEGYNHTGECVITGWGNANPTGGTPIIIPDALQKLNLEIVNQTLCRSLYNGISPVDDTMVCARGLNNRDNLGSCNGDSGGPLVCRDDIGEAYLAGIVSWGMNPCGEYQYPTVFGNVANKSVRDFLAREVLRP